jgi:hypothetical protein
VAAVGFLMVLAVGWLDRKCVGQQYTQQLRTRRVENRYTGLARGRHYLARHFWISFPHMNMPKTYKFDASNAGMMMQWSCESERAGYVSTRQR